MTVKKTRTANKAEATIKRLKLDQLRTDGGTHCRAEKDNYDRQIDEYVEAMKDRGERFPPVKARFDGEYYWLSDGFLRLAAAQEVGAKTIEVEVRRGTQRDAILDGVGANPKHGLPRTNADKRAAVSKLLQDSEWVKWSNREIARRCRVTHEFVATERKKLSGSRSQIAPKVKRNGTTYKIDTTRIGRIQRIAPEAREILRNLDTFDDRKALKRIASLPCGEHVKVANKIASGETKNVETAILKTMREARTEQLNIELPDLSSMGKYRTIMIDPPWKTPLGGRFSADSHYCTMTVEEIERKAPVAKFAADDAHLYLWTIQGFILEAFELVRRWGFEFKTMITWVKTDKDGEPRIGAGHHFRYCTEFALFAERGNVPPQQQNEPNVILAPRREHSQKPDEAFEMAERVSLEPRLEVFSRTDREGWTTWGDQAGSLGKRSKASEPDTLERAA